MAIYKLFPEKDATLYSEFPSLNTGLDEIIEASTFYNSVLPQVSRYVIKFSQTEIEDIVDNKIGAKNFQANFRNYIANITGLNAETTLEVYPISGSWNMGTGRYANSPQTENGVCWAFRFSSGSNPWDATSFQTYATASYVAGNIGGGNWYTGSNLGLNVTQSQVLDYANDKDLNIDVTNTILTWHSSSNSLGGFPNDGFLVKQSDEDEFIADRNHVTNVKYFSIDTHTIYPPQLEFKWDDFVYDTGSSSNTVIDTPHMVATLAHNKGTFRRDSVEKIRINTRPQFPERTFETGSTYTKCHFLPTASFYAIKDLDTNEFVIDFDTTYTKISADSESSYFTLYMNGLEPERYYQILLKVNINGETLILGDQFYFKVING